MTKVTFADCEEGWVFCGYRILLLKWERGSALAKGDAQRSRLGLMAERLRDEMRKEVARRNDDGLNRPPLDPEKVVLQTNGERYAGRLLGGRFQVMESFLKGSYYVADHGRDDLLVRAGGPAGETRRFATIKDAEAWIKGFAPELFRNKDTGALDAVPGEMKEYDDVPKVTKMSNAAKVATTEARPKPGPKVAKVATTEVRPKPGPKVAKAKVTEAKPAAGRAPGVGALTKELILMGLDNAAVIARLKQDFPDKANTASNVNWYRNRLKKEGVSVAPAVAAAKVQATKGAPKANAAARK